MSEIFETTDGKVGIGEQDPQAKLHVGGNLRLEIGEGLELLGEEVNGGQDYRILRLIDDNYRNNDGSGTGNVDGGLLIEGYNPAITKEQLKKRYRIQSNRDWREVQKTFFVITGTGRVGIGIDPRDGEKPCAKLHVKGETCLQGDFTVDGEAAIQQELDIRGPIKRKGGTFSLCGDLDDQEFLYAPAGTKTDEWSVFVSPKTMGREESGSEKDNALLMMQCYAERWDDNKWRITARYKYRVARDRDGVWERGRVNFLLVPK